MCSDHYPVDRLMHDVALALLAVQTQTIGILNDFPTTPGSDAGGEDPGLTLPEFIYSTYNSLLESGWRMDEIDRMDMPGFFRVRAWKASREANKKGPADAISTRSGRICGPGA